MAVHGGQRSPLSHWRSVLTAEHSTVKFRRGWRGWRGVVPLILLISVASDVPDLPGIQRYSKTILSARQIVLGVVMVERKEG